MVSHEDLPGGMCKSSLRVVVPLERHPNYNFIGRLLGPRCAPPRPSFPAGSRHVTWDRIQRGAFLLLLLPMWDQTGGARRRRMWIHFPCAAQR